MNIPSRLKKIESRVIDNDAEFCNCEKEVRFYVIYPGENGEPIQEPSEDYNALERCETCGKRNFEPIRTTFVIKPASDRNQANQDEYKKQVKEITKPDNQRQV